MLVAFYRGRRHAGSWLLAWWMRSDYSHVELVLRPVLGAQPQRYTCASAKLLEGVRVADIELPAADWEIVEVPGTVDRAYDWLIQHVGEGYDWLGLAGFVVRRVKGWLRLWWCSEAVAAMLGIPDPWRWDVATLRAHCLAVGKRVEL